MGIPGFHAIQAGIELLRAEGVDVEDLRSALGGLTDLDGPGWWASELGMRTLACGAQALVERTGDPQLGLRLGARVPFGAFGIIDYIARAVPTLRALIQDINALAPLAHDPYQWRVSEHGAYAELALVSRLRCEICPLFVDFRLSHLHGVARVLLQDPGARASSVRFPYGDPGVLAPYRARFGDAELQFGAVAPSLWFSRAYLDAPLPSHDPVLYALLRAHADVLTQSVPRDTTASGRLRAYLAEELPLGRISIEDAASVLGTTERTLRRRLAEEGTSYQEQLDQVRGLCAKALLADPSLSLERIATRMGFDSALAFRRAFRRWTGEGVSHWRR